MKFLLVISFLFLISCSSSRLSSKMKLVDRAAVTKSFRNVVEGVNNSYFEIKENNYFDSYRLLFDSVKNTRYAGTYTTTLPNDTITLQFFQPKGKKNIGYKGLDYRKNNYFF